MNPQGRLVLFTLAGIAAGLLIWIVIDILGLVRISDTVGTLSSTEARQYQIVGLLFGAFIGGLLGGADLLAQGNTGDWPRALGIGVGVGAVAGVLGLNLGMALFGALYSPSAGSPLHFIGNVIARALGWALIGAFAGTADGWRKLSFRVGRNGFLGGLIGGLIGGAAFEIVPYLMPGARSGPAARFVAFLLTGGSIGLFIALVQQWLKEAWIRVVLGRGEGKEFLIEKALTRIGRAELSEIPLYGDPNIGRTHALLESGGTAGWTVRDTGESSVGVLVNGERIAAPTRLRSGDEMTIASRTLVFYEKTVRQATAPVSKDIPHRPPAPQPGVSPYALPVAPPEPGGLTGRRLRITAGPHAGGQFPARSGLTIGRDASVDIALPSDTKASRRHARITGTADGGLAIEDLQSTNGTFVNGQRVTVVTLAVGDELLVGTTTLRVE
jgi:pSer/pThr/pTyr-binding forkhead associated (FHA) protein